MFYRRSKNWLRHRVIAQMRDVHPELFDPTHENLFRHFKIYVSDKRHWWVVALLVVSVFAISSVFSGVTLFNVIDLKDETARVLIDQRTANIATIFSITLVVVGFLINNLAVKSPLTYKLLFQKSYLYPTIYFTLSTIGCFIIVSTLRDTRIPCFDFSNAVLAGTYLVLVVLLMIGLLFKTIVDFTNDNAISDMLHREFMDEAKHNLKQLLMTKYSLEIYSSSLIEAGAQEYDYASSLRFPIISNALLGDVRNVNESKTRIVHDVNIKRVARFVGRKKRRSSSIVFFKRIGLNSRLTTANVFLWKNGELSSLLDRCHLRICVSLKSVLKNEDDTDAYRNYFDGLLAKLSEEGEFRKLEKVLDSYYELYSIQMRNPL